MLLADDVAHPTPELATHLTECGACRKLAAELIGIESAVRACPTSRIAISGRDAFLTQIAATPRRSRGRHRQIMAFAVLAASLVIGIGLAALVQPHPRTKQPSPVAVASAKPTVVEDLVELNLRLTEAEAPAERQKLVREQLPRYQAAVQTTNLSAEDRSFAEQLLVSAKKMGESTDPIDEAEVFHGLADTLLVRLDTMADDADRSEFYAKMYSQVVDRGVEVNLDRAERQAQKPEKQARVRNLKKAKHRQEVKAAALAERMHEKAREHVRPDRPKAKR
jgi:hypothetical protein